MKKNGEALPSVTDQEIQSRLAPPGAGIPLPAKLFLTWVMRPFVVHRSYWKENAERYANAHRKLAEFLKSVDEPMSIRRALVSPMRGLEDSSRYWSIAMTCRHLTIVGRQIEGAMKVLSMGQQPNAKADTAAVKPESELNHYSSIGEYLSFAESFIANLNDNVKNPDSKVTFKHPWFGPLNVNGWLWLMGTHTGIHTRQIREIRRNLG